ncbi:NUDIX hydrolase [Alicyclobacillus cycloheptanicus]|uniref:ADP-ribose pyrophosphatase n=1 Tax=Alicyclobacillus cycloheptanicus TaxID=1457 RepID=A0ABT9XDP2_9BACL|nr:NUDIX hydrolase [Alicyclobacillus cycloheptanicus]MDQ0188424.1 ADP-ribose pyrophosphatase [Alicyclobacillus cycloheptanicus]WDM01126.1 NUDIX hydrolase [Alicyclobacillus cycloheptanicus]
MNHKRLQEPTLATEPIYDGRIIRVEQLTIQLPNGKTAKREVVRHPGAVAVLAAPAPDRLVFVEQFRKPTEEVLLEIPAGKLEPGEDPAECARRELEEETGYVSTNVRPLYEFFTSPGFADEKLHLFVAEDLSTGAVHPDEDEFVNIVELTASEVQARLTSGQIRDAKTLIGVLWWLQHKDEQLQGTPGRSR